MLEFSCAHWLPSQGDSRFPSDEELCRRILETFEIIVDEKSECCLLTPRCDLMPGHHPRLLVLGT